jgi:hypothetical protein|nr:MAG TPA: hypothetical protein [Caudoviricetes sp.]
MEERKKEEILKEIFTLLEPLPKLKLIKILVYVKVLFYS